MKREILFKIIDAFMAEMFAEIPIIKCDNNDLLSEHFKIIDKYWRDNKEKLISDIIKYLKDVDKVEIID